VDGIEHRIELLWALRRDPRNMCETPNNKHNLGLNFARWVRHPTINA